MTPQILAYLAGKEAQRAGRRCVCPDEHRAHRERWERGWRVARLIERATLLAREAVARERALEHSG